MTDPSRPRWPPYLVFLAPALAALLLALASPFLPPGWARAFAAHSAESGLSLVMMFGSLTVFTLFLFAFLRASHRPRDVVACIALSTAIHFLIILFFGIWEVSRVPARPAAAEKTYRLAEGLPSVAEAEVGEEVRQQSLDLSVPTTGAGRESYGHARSRGSSRRRRFGPQADGAGAPRVSRPDAARSRRRESGSSPSHRVLPPLATPGAPLGPPRLRNETSRDDSAFVEGASRAPTQAGPRKPPPTGPGTRTAARGT
jgi:hypothetical protein